ncbi:MAG: hypothetical protein IMX00_11375 [Limnochordales bacterium]|nr:hypothetical protein [Limnochordales bacterium]
MRRSGRAMESQRLRVSEAYAVRALGTLQGVAIGDALGVPEVHYSKAEILKVYGGPITGFTEPIPHSGRK